MYWSVYDLVYSSFLITTCFRYIKVFIFLSTYFPELGLRNLFNNATTHQLVAKILQKYSPLWSVDTVFINGNVTGNHYGAVKTCQIVACAQLWYFLVNCFSSLPYLTGTNKAPIGDFYDLQLLTSPRFILSPVGNLVTIFMIPGG